MTAYVVHLADENLGYATIASSCDMDQFQELGESQMPGTSRIDFRGSSHQVLLC